MKKVQLPDSGREISVKSMGRFLVREIMRSIRESNPPPAPTRQKVNYGGEEVWEENLSHPDYLKRLEEYEKRSSELLTQKLLEVIAEVCVVGEPAPDEVSVLRAQMKAVGIELLGSDRYLWVTCLLCQTEKDLKAIQDAVMGISQPTGEGIASALSSFPPAV